MLEKVKTPKAPRPARNDELKHYELGYLLSPLVAPDALTETVEREVKHWLGKAGATIGGELSPRSISLAYRIKQTVEHHSSTYREAYLGAFYFTLEPEQLAVVEEGLKKSALIIRSLLITIKPDAFALLTRREAARVDRPAPVVLNTAAIDQEIDNLILIK